MSAPPPYLPLASFERVSAGCDGKMAYASWDLATKVAGSISRRTDRRVKLEPYRCPFCREWHLGNVKKGREHVSRH